MKRMLVLLCGFIIFQNIALRIDGADAAAIGLVDGVYFDYNGKEHVIPPWREWFTEIVTYNTGTGDTTYSIQGRGEMSCTFGTLPVD